MLRTFGTLSVAVLLAGCPAADAVGTGASASSQETKTAASGTKSSEGVATQIALKRITPVPKDQLPQTEAEWKQKLSADQFYVLRKHGTEPAFTNDHKDLKEHATFYCAGCGEPLFDSRTKFDSGTGWPSFYNVIGDVGEHVGTQVDRSLFMSRTEVHCQHCGGHLGHVFEDGPQPTGLRYCINSAALQLGAPIDATDEAQKDSDSAGQ